MMRKRLAIVLVFMLFISMLQVPVRAEDNPGPLTEYQTESGDYDYVIDGDVSINEPVQIGAGDVVRRINVASSGAITISSGGVLNLDNVSLTVTTGGSITGEVDGRIVFQGTETFVSGLSFYPNRTDPAMSMPTGTFEYDSGVQKWVQVQSDPGPGPGGGSPGAFSTFEDGENPGDYIITQNVTLNADESNVELQSGLVTINAGVTVTIGVNGRLELRGATLVNNGTILTDHDATGSPPESGQLILMGNATQLTNAGTITINGSLSMADSAKLSNTGTIIGGAEGRLMLDNPSDSSPGLGITGLPVYETASSDTPITDPNGEFSYQSGKWVSASSSPGGDDPQPPVSDGTARFVTVIPSANGEISRVVRPAEGDPGDPTITLIDARETIEVIHMDPLEFMIEPDAGYMVDEVRVTIDEFVENQSFLLSYNGDGTFQLPFEYVEYTQSVEIIYAPITEPRLTELLYQTYAVLEAQTGSAGDIQASLANQWGQYGFPVLPENVAIAAGSIDISGMATQEYGIFRYTLTLAGIAMPEQTGYILPSDDVVAFRVYGTHNGAPVDTVRVANQDEYDANEIEVPIVEDGYLDIFAYGNVMAFPMNSTLAESMVNGKTPLPFYVAQFHITSFMTGINLYGFYVIQEDAYCVNVDARSGEERQRALTWEFGRYANLTTGDDSSEVFFGNDTFELSLPGNDIGAVTSLEVETGDFQGYTVTGNEDGTWSVQFLSDFYDHVSLNVTINGTIARTLHVHRVGVDIELYEADDPVEGYELETQGIVGHGTQGGTFFSYLENRYQLYASYYIPDGGTEAPYGLYVTYTWQNGTTTTRIITEPCNNPQPSDIFEFSDGVFLFEDSAAAVDYLLYAAPDGSNAPIRVNVTVLKDDPTAAGSFGGVFLGSGRGVEWTADN